MRRFEGRAKPRERRRFFGAYALSVALHAFAFAYFTLGASAPAGTAPGEARDETVVVRRDRPALEAPPRDTSAESRSAERRTGAALDAAHAAPTAIAAAASPANTAAPRIAAGVAAPAAPPAPRVPRVPRAPLATAAPRAPPAVVVPVRALSRPGAPRSASKDSANVSAARSAAGERPVTGPVRGRRHMRGGAPRRPELAKFSPTGTPVAPSIAPAGPDGLPAPSLEPSAVPRDVIAADVAGAASAPSTQSSPASAAPPAAATTAPSVAATTAPSAAASTAPSAPASIAPRVPSSAPPAVRSAAPATAAQAAISAVPATQPSTQAATQTPAPTRAATQTPTQAATQAATQAPTRAPQTPTQAPTQTPTRTPQQVPMPRPTEVPTLAPTQRPELRPAQTAAVESATATPPTAPAIVVPKPSGPPSAEPARVPEAAPTARAASIEDSRSPQPAHEETTQTRPNAGALTSVMPGDSLTAHPAGAAAGVAGRAARAANGTAAARGAAATRAALGEEAEREGRPRLSGSQSVAAAPRSGPSPVPGPNNGGLERLNGRLNSMLPAGDPVSYGRKEYVNDLAEAVGRAREEYYRSAAPPPAVLARAIAVLRQKGTLLGPASILYLLKRQRILGIEICTGWKIEATASGPQGGYTFGACGGEDFTPQGGLPTLAPKA